MSGDLKSFIMRQLSLALSHLQKAAVVQSVTCRILLRLVRPYLASVIRKVSDIIRRLATLKRLLVGRNMRKIDNGWKAKIVQWRPWLTEKIIARYNHDTEGRTSYHKRWIWHEKDWLWTERRGRGLKRPTPVDGLNKAWRWGRRTSKCLVVIIVV